MKLWEVGAALGVVATVAGTTYYVVKETKGGGGGGGGGQQGKVTLTVQAGAGGTTMPSPGNYEYDGGSYLTIIAVPAAGYVFDSWSGDYTGTASQAQFQITQNMTIKANFKPASGGGFSTVNISVSGSGTTSPAPGTYTVAVGGTIQVAAIPGSGYVFAGWSGDSWTGTQNPITVNIWDAGGNFHLVANFVPTGQKGVQLTTGWNDGITYGGAQGTPDVVFASIISYLDSPSSSAHWLWVYRNGQWLTWLPGGGSANTLTIVKPGDIVDIYVSQACFWIWP